MFELLAALCSISEDAVSKVLEDIQNNQLVTVQLLQEEDIHLQVEAMVGLDQATAYAQVTSFLQLIQMMYRSNTLVSAFGTNGVAQIGFYIAFISSTYYLSPGSTDLSSYDSSCTETTTTAPALLYIQPLSTRVTDHTYWPQYYDVYDQSLVSASVDGFFGGCFPLDAVLASTLDCSIVCLLLFTSLKSQTVTIIEQNPSLTKYKQLQTLYPDTLTCPCANTSMPYLTFVSLSPVFHQVCSSDLISESWISLLSNSTPADVIIGTWFSKAAQYFGLLSSICQLASLTATENIHGFYARTFVTSYVLIERDFNIQVNATVKQLTESIVISFSLFNIMTRLFIQADQPITVAPTSDTQIILNLINTTDDTNNSQALQFTFRFQTISKNYSENIICQCVADPNCQGPIPFAIERTIGISLLPGFHFGQYPSDYVAPGLVDGCYSIDLLLLSTLQCFYTDSDCIHELFYYINKTYQASTNNPNLYAHPLIYNQTSTRFPPNTSVSSIVEEMMIEQWNTSLSFSDYYKACAPTYCTYTQIKHTETFSELLVTLISTVGGLVMVLRLITFQFVKFVFSLLRKKPKKQQQVRRKLLDRFKVLLSKLITFLYTKMLNVNIFPARTFGSKIDRITVKYLGQWSTRLYFILLTTIFVILTLYTAIQPQTLTKSFATPSLTFYKNLMNDHNDKLECPCSLISSPYDRYVEIQPIFHQICSSGFISNEWRLNITANLASDLSPYSQKDYRRFLSTHLHFLGGLCQLSIQTVNQSIQQSLSSLMITKQLLSEENFILHINSMINEAKSNAPSTFIRLLSLLQATNHGNAIVSVYGTNYQYIAPILSTYQT
ncbi:unnamed protein product, partial [Adineta steineri]